MTKADIAMQVQRAMGETSKSEVSSAVNAVLDIIKDTLIQGNNVKIAGFGNFVVRDKNERAGRNPQTGGTLTISARRVVVFQASKLLTKNMNS